MGPLAMTGLVCFGAAVGLGLLASRARPAAVPADAPRIRGLFIVAAAFIEGIGTWGLVGGILAIVFGTAAGAPSAAVVVGLAVIGALLGIALIVRQSNLVDRQAAYLAGTFALGLATLGVVTGILASILDERATKLPPDWPFVAIGLVSGSSALAVGWVGGQALAAASALDPDLSQIQATLLRRCLPLMVVGYGAIGLALLILFFG